MLYYYGGEELSPMQMYGNNVSPPKKIANLTILCYFCTYNI
jgi:hypothetical protein